jgi:hypothetical protein
MGNIWEEMAEDGPEFLDEFGRMMTYRGATFKVLLNRSMDAQMLSDGGFTYSSGYTVRMLCPDGHAYKLAEPRQGEQITVFNKQYTITGVNVRSPDPWIDIQVKLTSSV